MRHALLALILLLAPLAAHAEFLDCIFFDGLENSGTTDATALGALQIHNCARKKVSPVATPPLASLTWSNTVASQAQLLAGTCVFEHGSFGGYGQNIYAGAGSPTPTLNAASLAWASEATSYDYTSNTCAPNKTCGHYTQVVWRTTQQLGCAVQDCSTHSPFEGFPNWTFIVCDYSPAGNDGGGQPY